MADFHAADLWVAVVPETSQVGPAMEKAGKEAKDKFGSGVKGFGQKIHDELDQIGAKTKDAFGKAGKMGAEALSSELGKELTQTAAKEIGAALGEAVRDLPMVQRGVELFQQWGDAAKVGAKGIQGLADAMRSAKAKDFAGALEGVDRTLHTAEPLAKQFGIDISSWSGEIHNTLTPLGEMQNRTKDIRSGAHDFLDTFKGMPGTIGKASTAMAAFVDGPLAAAIAAATLIDEKLHIDEHTFDPGEHGWGHVLFGKVWDWLGPGDPKTGLDKHLTPPAAGPPATPSALPPALQNLLLPGGVPGIQPMPGMATSGAPLHPSGWDGVAGAESHGDWSINTGNGYYGGLQFDQNTWNDFGGQDFASRPDLASRDQQIAVANRVPVSQRAGRWPRTYQNFGKGGSGGDSGVGSASSGGLNLDTIPISVQKYANDCIDASARIILSHAGINMTEDQLKGIITPGGTIDSLAAGLNRLDPAGRFTAMQGSGGSPAAMFNAIKASIESGTGSILNVAPGSSLAGRNFGEGHFIAATGYNPDGTINLSDTAGGKKYSVSATDAFQATRGRGIVAGTGSGPPAGGQIPTGAEHDPLYVMQSSQGSGGGGSSPFEQQGQQLGQGLGKGLLQLFGIDGSVLGGKSPLDWGAVKLGGGLLNWGMGAMGAMGGGPMGSPGLGGGGGGGMVSGLAGLIPHPGQGISTAAGGPGGSISLGAATGGGSPINIHNTTNLTGNFKDNTDLVQQQKWAHNATRYNVSPVPVG